MQNKLSLDLLRTFTVFVNEGTVDQAAQKLSLTQAAVSLQLKRLEQDLGRPLFGWSGRKKVLTSFGKDLSAQLSPPLMQLESLLAEVSILSKDEPSPSLKVTGSSLLGLLLDDKWSGVSFEFSAIQESSIPLEGLLKGFDIVLSFEKPEKNQLILSKEILSLELIPVGTDQIIQKGVPVLHSDLFAIPEFKQQWGLKEFYRAVDWLQAIHLVKKKKTWTYLPKGSVLDSGLRQISGQKILKAPVFGISQSLESLKVF